jgi:hypothetical protein
VHGYAFGRRIVFERSGEIVFRGFEFQWRLAHARRESGELGFAVCVRANFEIELVKSSESICDVDLHAGSVDWFGIRPKHRYFQRAAPEAAINNARFLGSLGVQGTIGSEQENTEQEQAFHGRDYSLPTWSSGQVTTFLGGETSGAIERAGSLLERL